MNTDSIPYHLVIGLGVSGLSMARFLHAKGVRVIATDIDPARADAADILNPLGIETQIGFHDQETFDRAHCLVPSPGIPTTSKYIAAALEKGVQLAGELDIFSDGNRLPLIAITGTNGKTTVTTLIGHLLKAGGKTPFVGGNIGTPLVETLMSKKPYDIIVAEISSFQLDISNRFRPDIALLLNITEDHMDRYKTLADYVDAKWGIFKNQTPNDTAILNAAIPDIKKRSAKLASKVLQFSSQKKVADNVQAHITGTHIRFSTTHEVIDIDTGICPVLLGSHNHENIAAAVLACLGAGAEIKDIKKGLETFNTLPHRIERVRAIDGITFYNDSKATNIDAATRALACFDRPIILILGGRERGTDLSPLTTAIQKNVRTIIAIGESRNNIKQIFSSLCPVFKAGDMTDAVTKAFDAAQKNDTETVLLSPACASFDMYDSYGHRGDDFKAIVNRIKTHKHETEF